MTQTTVEPTDRPAAIVWYRNIGVLRVVTQVVAVLGVVALLWWLLNNLVTNLNRLNISTDFGFLSRPTQFQIPFDEGFNPRSSVWYMVLVGVKNTFLAGFFGIILASIVGLIVGVSRLSSNWLVARIAALYVETLRNIPPLVVIIFFGFALFTFGPFPILSEAYQLSFFGSDDTALILSNTIWGVPSLIAGDGAGVFWSAVLIALIAAGGVARWRTRYSDRTGQPHHRVLYFLGTLLVVAAAGYLVAGDVYRVSWPVLGETGRRIFGGFQINYGFISVTLALGLYTASHIAEIIRGSILAVPKGQTEAANAIALSSFQRYRHVILPQAFRTAVPPIISQYLNLVKNTSLGVAVAYAEITALTLTSIGNGRPAPQSILILMAVYLTFSLTISFFLNIYNRRIQLVER
ncbi:MAG TPA: ABC transporter permease subunit [Acidimicrobiia bacterium]|nr:ABC transporter permease subunit [Acidimicrobiia bacterium]